MAEGVPYSRLVQEVAGEADDEGLLRSAGAAVEEESNGVDEVPEPSQRTGLLWSKPQPNPGAADADDPTDSATPLGASPKPWCTFTTNTLTKDVSMMLRVFFVHGLFVDRRWVFPLLLACSAGCYEAAAATILNVISDFYLAISSQNAGLFLTVCVVFFVCCWCIDTVCSRCCVICV